MKVLNTPYPFAATHRPTTPPGDTCACRVGTQAGCGDLCEESCDPHTMGRAPRSTGEPSSYPESTPTRGPSCVPTPVHVSGLCVCAQRPCSHREVTAPSLLPGEGIWRPEGLGVIGFGISYLCCLGSFLCFIFSLINPQSCAFPHGRTRPPNSPHSWKLR